MEKLRLTALSATTKRQGKRAEVSVAAPKTQSARDINNISTLASSLTLSNSRPNSKMSTRLSGKVKGTSKTVEKSDGDNISDNSNPVITHRKSETDNIVKKSSDDEGANSSHSEFVGVHKVSSTSEDISSDYDSSDESETSSIEIKSNPRSAKRREKKRSKMNKKQIKKVLSVNPGPDDAKKDKKRILSLSINQPELISGSISDSSNGSRRKMFSSNVVKKSKVKKKISFTSSDSDTPKIKHKREVISKHKHKDVKLKIAKETDLKSLLVNLKYQL